MTIPYYVNEHTSDIRAVKPGWYGMESGGKLSSGPFQNEEKCLTGITHAKGKFRASPWLRTRASVDGDRWVRLSEEDLRALHQLRHPGHHK
jgi:hypothetical protein